MTAIRLLAAATAALALAGPARAAGAVAIVNRSTEVTDAQIQAAIPAMQAALDEDYQPVWGATARLHLATRPQDVTGWTLTLADGGDGWALGYHDVGRRHHRPFALVYPDASADSQVPWTVVAVHELEELLADPYLARREQVGRRFYYVEPCDPVETRTYTRAGVALPDFVTPAWYQPQAPGPYDFLGLVHHPLQLLSGGYDAYLDQGGWIVIEEA